MKKIAVVILSISLLQGCALAVVAGVGVGAASYNDRRTFESQVDDQAVELNAHTKISENAELAKNSDVQIVSLNGTVLIVGQAVTPEYREQLFKIVSDVKYTKKVHNQVRIAKLSTFGTKTTDTWLTTKVKTKIIADERLNGLAIKVVTEDSEVFLMGIVNAKEADIAVDIARHVNGVSRVYKAFEMIK